MTNRISAATTDEVRRLYLGGQGMMDIAASLGLTYKQVSHACRDIPKRAKWTREQVEEAISALTKRLNRTPTLDELGAEWGMSGAGAGAVLHRTGVEKPPSSSTPVRERLRRQALAERKSKRRAAMAKRRSRRDAKIVAMSKHKRQHKKTRQEIADAVGVHVNVVYRVLREAKS